MEEVKRWPATLAFFAILEKGKDIRVFPRVLNFEFMTAGKIAEIPVGKVFAGLIKIPEDISESADHFLVLIQSRPNWGRELSQETILFEIPTVKLLAQELERSLNEKTFRKDFQTGLSTPADNDRSSRDGMEPGQNWA